MQKRRTHAASGGTTLPLTNADVNDRPKRPARVPPSRLRRRTRKSRDGCMPFCCFLIVVLTAVSYVSLALFSPAKKDSLHQYISDKKRTLLQKKDDFLASVRTRTGPLPLDDFASLEYPLENSRLVGLYFAASWCPMSTSPTNLLDEYFRDVLLPPPNEASGPPSERAPLSIVYVSSDESEQQLESYVKQNWIPVPFGSEDRTALKRHFAVCAKRELRQLDMDRKYEIPTLIIIDAITQNVLTTDGVGDLTEHGADALEHWTNLLNLVEDIEFEEAVKEEHQQLQQQQ